MAALDRAWRFSRDSAHSASMDGLFSYALWALISLIVIGSGVAVLVCNAEKWQREFQSRRISPKSCALRPHGFSGQRPGRQVFFCRGSRAMARVSKGDRETGADGAATIKLTHYRRQGYCPNSGASVRRARGWARTRPWSGRCSERVSLSPSQSCPDCTTITSGYDFRKRQVPRIGQLRCGIKDIGGNSVRGV